jgi:hypothetical protein
MRKNKNKSSDRERLKYIQLMPFKVKRKVWDDALYSASIFADK